MSWEVSPVSEPCPHATHPLSLWGLLIPKIWLRLTQRILMLNAQTDAVNKIGPFMWGTACSRWASTFSQKCLLITSASLPHHYPYCSLWRTDMLLQFVIFQLFVKPLGALLHFVNEALLSPLGFRWSTHIVVWPNPLLMSSARNTIRYPALQRLK